ncbi:MAG: acetylxylan esterase, partial [Planctomycetes bacterium]|nr:acetylxylan esterase [Planctomycetota bacterium]
MDARWSTVFSLITPRPFRAPRTAAAWRARAELLRRRILAAAGLTPMPPRHPVRAHVTSRCAHAGFHVENLWFAAGRGLSVAGNLYLPDGPGPFPAVLHPHGHWTEGRRAHDVDGSSLSFACALARAGYAVFAWDMIGYNDSRYLPHDFRDPAAARLGITLAGLQLWNSLRALDFLAAHPQVDPLRIGIAGASGGASQALLLAAVDERVRAAALVCMISAHMQGGCRCENAPGLRLDTDNVEFAALLAPRPLLLVSCTRDWTATTPRRELPALRRLWRTLGAAEKVAGAHFDLPHNLLEPSRRAAYDWLAQHLPGPPVGAEVDPPAPAASRWTVGSGRWPVDEVGAPGGPPVPASRLRVFPRGGAPPLPRGRALVACLCREAARRARPDPETLRALLGIERPLAFATGPGWIGRRDRGDHIPIRWRGARAADRPGDTVTLLVHDGTAAARAQALRCAPATGPVLEIDVFGTGRAAAGGARRARHARAVAEFWSLLERWSDDDGGSGSGPRNVHAGDAAPPPSVRCVPEEYFDTYNRTDDAERIQDVGTALAWLAHRARGAGSARRIRVVARGRAGGWALLGAQMSAFGAELDVRVAGRLD